MSLHERALVSPFLQSVGLGPPERQPLLQHVPAADSDTKKDSGNLRKAKGYGGWQKMRRTGAKG